MMKLGGIHDREGRHIVPAGGWCLDTITLADNPTPTDYTQLKADINWIVRANWGYGRTGTIPSPAHYEEMARRLARYAAQSPGCRRWIIGNEPNLPREWPGNPNRSETQPIHPIQYAECYLDCRYAIKSTPGHEHDEVLIAAPGPWNAELKYAGNIQGDWIAYFEDVQDIVRQDCDGFSFHAYARGYDPAAVKSEARMDAPFAHRRAGFRVYRDFAAAIRPELRHLPRYLTEVNGNGPWEAKGHIPAVLAEISDYNASEANGFSCVIFYRYPDYDSDIKFHMEGKADVIAEFTAAMQREYVLPQSGVATTPKAQQFIPSIATGPTAVTPPLPTQRSISDEFKRRVPEITLISPKPGQRYFELEAAEYVPDGARRFGPDHHILVEVLGLDGKRKLGETVHYYYADGDIPIATNKVSEPYAVDYGMTQAGHAWGVWVGSDRAASDHVFGMGLGKIGSEDIADHVTYYLLFREKIAPVAAQPQPKPEPQQPVAMPALTHPVEEARYRVVTQAFGVNEEYYKKFTIDDVPLRGHEGIDFGTPMYSWIVAVNGGRVVEVGNQGSKGYGKYVKIVHPWGESVYAHLSDQNVAVGDSVHTGQRIGRSGNTGNSSGPHLHFGLRVTPYDRKDGWGGYVDPAPYLSKSTVPAPTSSLTFAELITITRAAAEEFGVDWRLLASLIQAESSYNPSSINLNSGARGLGNFMAATWAEWAAKVGATDIFNATDNARATAAYLAWCITTAGGAREGLWAYNWGIGRVLDGLEPPLETIEYANKVLFGRDLLMVAGV